MRCHLFELYYKYTLTRLFGRTANSRAKTSSFVRFLQKNVVKKDLDFNLLVAINIAKDAEQCHLVFIKL